MSKIQKENSFFFLFSSESIFDEVKGTKVSCQNTDVEYKRKSQESNKKSAEESALSHSQFSILNSQLAKVAFADVKVRKNEGIYKKKRSEYPSERHLSTWAFTPNAKHSTYALEIDLYHSEIMCLSFQSVYLTKRKPAAIITATIT